MNLFLHLHIHISCCALPCIVNNSDLQVVVSVLIFIFIANVNTLYIDKFVVRKTFPAL
jgi:hypothetical protein